MLFFLSFDKSERIRPSASTTSKSEHEIARIAIGDHIGAAGIGREIAADGAGSLRLQATAETAGSRGSASSCASAKTMPASTVIVFEAGSISRSARMRVSESTIAPPPAPGIWPPTSPVLPPCGTTGVAGLMAKFQHRRDFLRGAWLHDAKRLAMKEIARLVQKPVHPGGIGDDMVFADDGLETRDNAGKSRSLGGCVQI